MRKKAFISSEQPFADHPEMGRYADLYNHLLAVTDALTKITIAILLLMLVSPVFGGTNEFVNTNTAMKAELVVRAKAVGPPTESTYLWYDMQVLRVIKNVSGVTVTNRVEVASRRPGLPAGELTLYLERFEKETPGVPKGRWRLVGGDASTGASHSAK